MDMLIVNEDRKEAEQKKKKSSNKHEKPTGAMNGRVPVGHVQRSTFKHSHIIGHLNTLALSLSLTFANCNPRTPLTNQEHRQSIEKTKKKKEKELSG